MDAAKVGGFGASLGGESLLLMAGAQLTTTVGQAYKQVTFDPRLKAAATYVPYFGQVVFPAFGRDQNGLQGVTLPLLAISGTADTTAPIAATEKGFGFLTNTRQLVALTDVEHGFDPAFSDEIFTWSLAFLAGQLSGDPVARATSARMTSVAGGGEDVLETDYIAPSPAQVGERIVVEFRNDALNHYFITAEPAEAAMLDAGVVVPGWQRTGFNFKEWARDDPHGLPACRFFGTPGIGPNSHFYTISDYECCVDQGQSVLALRGHRVQFGRAGGRGVRGGSRSRRSTLQQRHGRAGQPSLRHQPQRSPRDGPARMDGRGRRVLRDSLKPLPSCLRQVSGGMTTTPWRANATPTSVPTAIGWSTAMEITNNSPIGDSSVYSMRPPRYAALRTVAFNCAFCLRHDRDRFGADRQVDFAVRQAAMRKLEGHSADANVAVRTHRAGPECRGHGWRRP